ncbi:MAG: hypothetical protein GY820_21765, partial [Gammaproteobacteria bacterium]|nr:hypothetical protein [Gammaproteobacteria bacterium]
TSIAILNFALGVHFLFFLAIFTSRFMKIILPKFFDFSGLKHGGQYIRAQVHNQHQNLIAKNKIELKQKIKPTVDNNDIQAEETIKLLFAKIDVIQKKHEEEFINGKCQNLNNNDGELSLKAGGSCLSDDNAKKIKAANEFEIQEEMNAILQNVDAIIKKREKHNENKSTVELSSQQRNQELDKIASANELNLNQKNSPILYKTIQKNKRTINNTGEVAEFSFNIDKNNLDQSVSITYPDFLEGDQKNDKISAINSTFEETIDLIKKNHDDNKQSLQNTFTWVCS